MISKRVIGQTQFKLYNGRVRKMAGALNVRESCRCKPNTRCTTTQFSLFEQPTPPLQAMHRQLVQHVRLTWFEKIAIIEKAKLAPYMSYNELAQWARLELSLPAPPNKSTIGRVLKSSARLLRQPAETAIRKNALSDLRLALDENVVEFVMLAEAENVSITGAMIIHQAKELAAKMRICNDAKPRIGSSWLRCLQERYGFRWKRAFGESSSVDIEAANEGSSSLGAPLATTDCATSLIWTKAPSSTTQFLVGQYASTRRRP
jgi:hypothetical protein